MKKKCKKSAWTAYYDPMYITECPYCKNLIIMSSPSLIDKLKRWAKQIIKP